MSDYSLKTEQQKTYKKANNVECVTELACKLGDILSLGARASNLEYFVESDGVNYKAKIIFNVVYLLEGEIRRKEFGIELTDFYKLDLEEGAKISLELAVESVGARRGEKLSLQGVVNAEIKVNNIKLDSLLGERQNLQTRLKEAPFTEIKGVAENLFTIDDELEISRPLKNVLYSGANAQIISCQCGLGCIICDGEIVLSLALLPNQEKSDIIKETRVIPFRLELEESSVSINDLSCARVKVNNVNLKVTVEEENGKTNIATQIEIIINAKAYKAVNISYVDDTFSLDKELSLTKQTIGLKNFIKQKSTILKIGGKAFCIPPDNSRIVCTLEERVYAVTYKQEKDKVILQGVASCYIAFEDINSGAICSKLAEMPFELEFAVEDLVEDIKVGCRNILAKIRSDEIELEGEILVSYNTFTNSEIFAVTAVEEGAQLPKDNSAFCIYCPQVSDTIWDIAKALKTTEQEILEQNEIAFPLSGQEKIIIYKKA